MKHEQEFAPSLILWDSEAHPSTATGTVGAWETPGIHTTATGVYAPPSIWDWAEEVYGFLQASTDYIRANLSTLKQGNVNITPNIEPNGKPNKLPILEGSNGIHNELHTHFDRRVRIPVSEVDLFLDYPEIPSLEEQHVLLNDEGDIEENSSVFSNSVILSAEFLRTIEGRRSVRQYSLLGTLLQPAPKKLYGALIQPQQENRLFLNTNIPSSFFICGLQGSGKSHTLSCLLGT